MKKLFFIFLFFSEIQISFSQNLEFEKADRIGKYFQEINNATKRSIEIWNHDLYGSMLLVDPKSRVIYGNEPDLQKSLIKQHGIYVGKLPDSINIANTSVRWNGKQWAMIMLPLSENKYNRINLLAHELFHKAQSSLGFAQKNTQSNHLNQKDGRIYLRLELEALKKAVLSDSKKERKKHLSNAFIFRKYRNILFPGSAAIENQLELNEGLAEYTGMMISGRNRQKTKQHFVHEIDAFVLNPSYVRSFAYYTTPIYGYLLHKKDKYWNQKINSATDLTDFFINDFQIIIPGNLQAVAGNVINDYNANSIFTEEKTREEKIRKQIADYKIKFIDQPHFEIGFEKMNVSFDPRNVFPLEDSGTVYPNIRVTDNWGILEVKHGSLLSPNWDKISLSLPLKEIGQKIEGDGWVLELKEHYTIVEDVHSNNHILVKKQ
ncbi:hypothetical protein [Pedobacter jeongneungensis]|uniref:hypothetical protein n=1 Tax=Pedobacter jeongneungensis TaxID=947309 RepID=UPI0004683693|nr:hypothetical protein [Pedobacter jeongneungensis]